MTLRMPKRLRQSKSHARSKVQEKELASRIGGKTTKRSGGGSEKGDVRLRGWTRIECKTTKRSTFSVNSGMIDKIEQAAMSAGELPVIHIELEEGKREVVVMPRWALDMLMERVLKTL